MLKVSTLIFLLVLSLWANAKNRDVFDLSLEELLAIPVESTSFFKETLAVTSYSVRPLEPKQWQSMGVRNLGELMNRMPSTVAPLRFGQSRAMAIRGYLEGETNKGIAMRFDGIPMNKIREGSGLMALDGFDLSLLQSVELIRGPGSSLHGNDAFHGVLSLKPRDAEGVATHATLEWGDLDYQAGSVYHSAEYGRHQWLSGGSYRKIGEARQGYSYVDNETGESARAYRSNDRESVNVLLKHASTYDSWDWSTTFFALDFDGDELPGVGDQQDFGDLQDKDFSYFSEAIQLGKIAARYEFDPKRSLKVSSYYWQSQDEFFADFRAIPSLGIRNVEQREEKHSGFQLHFLNRTSEHSHFTLGYEYLNARLDRFDLQAYAVNDVQVADLSGLAGAGYRRELHSLLLDGVQSLNQRGLYLSYGARFDEYSDFDAQTTPRIGLSQHWSEGHKLHLTYGEGFRATSLFERFGTDRILPNSDIQPETLKSRELKYTFTQETALHALTFFKNNWTGVIQVAIFETPGGEFAGRYENQGEKSAKGLEYELSIRRTKLQLDFNLSYVDDTSNIDGEQLQGFPSWISDLNIGYMLDERWAVYANTRYMQRDNFPLDGGGEALAVHYLRSDWVLDWKDASGLNVSLVFRNILDRNNAMPSSQGRPEGLADEGFNISSRVRFEF